MHLFGAEMLRVSGEYEKEIEGDADLDSWVLYHAVLFVEYQWVFVRIFCGYLLVAVR